MGPEIVWVGDERPLERLAEEASLAKSTGFDAIAMLSSEGSEKPNPLSKCCRNDIIRCVVMRFLGQRILQV